MNRSSPRVLPAGIGIENRDHSSGKSFQLLTMVFAEGGSHRGDSVGNPFFKKTHHVHVPLYDYRLTFQSNAALIFIKPVILTALREQGGLRGIDVLRLVLLLG